MDFAKMLNSVDDAIYEVMVWLMLIPRTIYLVVFRPNLAISYVNSEWEKKPEERFDEYLSPALLWLLISVVPSTISNSIASILSLLDQHIAQQFAEMKFEDKLIINALFALIAPLVYLIVLEWVNKETFKRTTLKRVFYLQCYAIVPGQLLILIATLLSLGATYLENLLFIGFTGIISLLSIILAISYEARFFHTELAKERISWIKAIWYSILSYIIFFILILAVIGVILAYVAINSAQ